MTRYIKALPKRNTHAKQNFHKGVTLLELTIALSVWMILSLSVLFVWQYTSRTTLNTLAHQSAFENARVSMDALIMNIQLADTITLNTNSDDILREIILRQPNPQGQLVGYTFAFNADTQRLLFGGQEFASNIARIYVTYMPGRKMNITVETACEEAIVLHGSVDVRYKNVIIE